MRADNKKEHPSAEIHCIRIVSTKTQVPLDVDVDGAGRGAEARAAAPAAQSPQRKRKKVAAHDSRVISIVFPETTYPALARQRPERGTETRVAETKRGSLYRHGKLISRRLQSIASGGGGAVEDHATGRENASRNLAQPFT